MSDRCELSDLPLDQCACRKHNPPVWQQPIGITHRFSAQWDSNCAWCGNRMHKGDEIAHTEDDDYVCSECAS